MIGYLHGTVIARREHGMILEVAGVGYRVNCAQALLHRTLVGDDCALFMYHHVREDISELFGFESEKELEFFERLLSVSGVGPKTALSIVGVASLDRIAEAIGRGDATLLKTVSGIGTKTAERIVVELKKSFQFFRAEQSEHKNDPVDGDIIEALVGLGYALAQARDVVHAIPSHFSAPEDRLREALKKLGTR